VIAFINPRQMAEVDAMVFLRLLSVAWGQPLTYGGNVVNARRNRNLLRLDLPEPSTPPWMRQVRPRTVESWRS